MSMRIVNEPGWWDEPVYGWAYRGISRKEISADGTTLILTDIIVPPPHAHSW